MSETQTIPVETLQAPEEQIAVRHQIDVGRRGAKLVLDQSGNLMIPSDVQEVLSGEHDANGPYAGGRR